MNIIKSFISQFIRLDFQFITKPSVATITAGLRNTVADLEAHSAEQIRTMVSKTEAAAKLLKERAEHEEEHILASKTAQNIKALLSV